MITEHNAVRFGAEVRRRREALQWTLDDLAKRGKLTPNYLGSIELGLRDPSLSTITKIARAFSVSIGELLGTHILSPAALEYLRLRKEAPSDVRDAVDSLIKAVSKRRRFERGALQARSSL